MRNSGYKVNHFSSILNLKNLHCGTRAYRELQSASEPQSASDHNEELSPLVRHFIMILVRGMLS